MACGIFKHAQLIYRTASLPEQILEIIYDYTMDHTKHWKGNCCHVLYDTQIHTPECVCVPVKHHTYGWVREINNDMDNLK